MSNQEGAIKSGATTPLHHLALNFIFSDPIPSQERKSALKGELLEEWKATKDADRRVFYEQLVENALEDPYDRYSKLKTHYPPWFTEYLVYLWDSSGLLNNDNFELDPSNAKQMSTTVVEYSSTEYLEYIISQNFEGSLEICHPYLKIVDDESVSNLLSRLVDIDFDPESKGNESFKLYEKVYKEHINIRGLHQLQVDYQRLLEIQGSHFADKEKDKIAKESFYNCLKYLAQKDSIKSFNSKVVNQLKSVFDPQFHPDELLDEEMPEYNAWKERSEPFKFLWTYCDLLLAIKAKDNKGINASLAIIYTEVQVPLQHRIRVIQTVCNNILDEGINIDQDIIMDMIIEFEKYEARNPAIIRKYKDKFISSQEMDLMRYALNQALSCSLIRG